MDGLYEISSADGYFEPFRVRVKKGKVVESSDQSHAAGADFKSLKEYYESRQYKCIVKEVKEQ